MSKLFQKGMYNIFPNTVCIIYIYVYICQLIVYFQSRLKLPFLCSSKTALVIILPRPVFPLSSYFQN